MGLTEVECKEKSGKIYDLVDTKRKVCILPEEKKEEAKKGFRQWQIEKNVPHK